MPFSIRQQVAIFIIHQYVGNVCHFFSPNGSMKPPLTQAAPRTGGEPPEMDLRKERLQ